MMHEAVGENEGSRDTALIALARQGDREAFGLLVERHYDFIHRVAWRWCGTRADAEDIAQEVCLRLARTIGGFRGEGRFSTWLYALTLNAARDHGRKLQREAARRQAYALHALGADAVDPRNGDDETEELWAAVRELPQKQRAAMLLVYGEGLSHEAASNVMGCAEATVSWHIHEAKRRLRATLRAAGKA